MVSAIEVLKNLINSENPFQWKLKDDLEIVPDNIIERLIQKIDEKCHEDNSLFTEIILNIALGYEYYIDEKLPKSVEIFGKIENLIQNENCKDTFLQKYSEVFLHVIFSSKTYVLMHIDDLETAFEYSKQISQNLWSNSKNKAAIFGIKAAVYSQYGIYGTKLGIQLAVKANELNPEESLWYFLKGKLLGRVRRFERPYDIPSKVELEALKTAFEKEINHGYAVFLAEAYRETAYRTFHLHMNERKLFPDLKEEINRMNKTSFELYKKSLELECSSPHLMFRCAKGFLKLPVPYKDNAAAKKLLITGLKIAPNNSFGHHLMANYYERVEKDQSSALEHLRICVKYKVYGSCMDLLRILINQDKLGEEEILSELNKIYEDYPEECRRHQTLSQFISFYIFFKPDLTKAFEYIIKVLHQNSNCSDILKHRSLFIKNFHNCFSLIDVIIDEIKIKLKNKTISTSERNKYDKFLENLHELGIPIPITQPKYLKNEIVQTSIHKYNSFENSGKFKSRLEKLTVNHQTNFVNSNLQTQHENVQKVNQFMNDWKKDLLKQCSSTKTNEKTFKKENVKDKACDNDNESQRLGECDLIINDKIKLDVAADQQISCKKSPYILNTKLKNKRNSPETSCMEETGIRDKFESMHLSHRNSNREKSLDNKYKASGHRKMNDNKITFDSKSSCDDNEYLFLKKNVKDKHAVAERDRELLYDSDVDFEQLILKYRKNKKQQIMFSNSSDSKKSTGFVDQTFDYRKSTKDKNTYGNQYYELNNYSICATDKNRQKKKNLNIRKMRVNESP